MLSVWLVLAAAALAAALPPGRGPAATLPRPARPLFDRSHAGPLALVDPLRPRASQAHRHKAGAQKAATRSALYDGADPGRLPTALVPTSYTLTLTPHLSGNFTFDGEATIHFNTVAATNKIVLHSKQLTFTKDNCKVYNDAAIRTVFATVTDLTFDPDLEFATFSLDKSFEAGSSYVLAVSKYSGILNDDMDGFYRSSYKTSSGETRWLATTQFEPTGARRAFPCWDEPSFKARWSISIKHDSNLMAISNMPRHNRDPSADGQVVDSFQPTPLMSSYLVAFIVSDFKSVVNTENNFTTWAREDIVAGGALSQEIGPAALRVLEEFNGIEYTLRKMDQAAIPDFSAGAMENWGLVTYREPDLIVTADTTSSGYEYIATVICHEFGHQWTGDLVTLDWWSHTWLNEGFATFYENMICDQIKPQWNLEDKMLPTFYHTAMESDVRETQVAMSSPVNSDAADINDHFGVISYDKGGSVLRMLYYALTPDVFKKGMKRYLSENEFGSGTPEKLFAAMDAEAALSNLHQLPGGVTFAQVASTWTEQPGVPVLQATRDYAKPGTVNFAQQRFLYAPAKDPSNVGQKYWIPLVVTTQTQRDFATSLPQGWLDPNVSREALQTNAAANEWVLVNPRQTGYFRVNYDATNWQLLAAALAADVDAVPASSRAQLLNDALTLARAAQLDYALALPFLQSLRAERSVTVWQAATAALKYLLARVDTTTTNDALLALIKDVTADAYASVGYTNKDGDSHETAYLRYIVASLACFAGNADCLSGAAAGLSAWLADANSSPLQVDTKAVTLCYGVRGSDAATFENMRLKWFNEQDSSLRYTYASALGCTADKSLLQGLLADATAMNKYSFDDGVMLFNAIYDRLDNHGVLLEFVKENADAINNAFHNAFDVQLLDGLIRDIRARSELAEVRVWVEAKYKSTAQWQKLQAAFDSTENELQTWGDKYLDKVTSWLAQATNTTPSPPTTPAGIPTSPQTTPGGNPTTPQTTPGGNPTTPQTTPGGNPTTPQTTPGGNPTSAPNTSSTPKPSGASAPTSAAAVLVLALYLIRLC